MFPAGKGKGARASRATDSRTPNSRTPAASDGAIDDKNKHLFFDEAVIVVAGGAGGDGEAWTKQAKAKTVKNFKYQWGRNIKKFIDLPLSLIHI